MFPVTTTVPGPTSGPLSGGFPIVSSGVTGSRSPQAQLVPKNQGDPGVWTQTGHRAKLHTIGAPLDSNQQVQDTLTGETKAGVGIFFQQEHGDWIYVANVVPGSSADLSGRVRTNDELVRVDEFEVNMDSSLEQIRGRILGTPGSYVRLAFRRPGGQHGMSRKDDYFFFDVDLVRGKAVNREDEQAVRAPAPSHALRAAPAPPPDDMMQRKYEEEITRKYEDEIARLRDELDHMRQHHAAQGEMEDPRVLPLEQELKSRMDDLHRFEGMLTRAQERTKEAEAQKEDAMQHAAALQQEIMQLQAKSSQDAQMVENLNARAHGESKRLQNDNDNLKIQLDIVNKQLENAKEMFENERQRSQTNSSQYQEQISKMTEEMNRLRAGHDEKLSNEASIRSRLQQGHAQLADALRTQESQMAVLADIVPSLDMVHSSLISSIALDPIRLQSYQSAQAPRAELTTLGTDFGGRPLSMSMNAAYPVSGGGGLLSSSYGNSQMLSSMSTGNVQGGLVSMGSGMGSLGAGQSYGGTVGSQGGGSALELA